MEGYNEDYLNGLIAKAKKSWEGVAVDNYMKNLRDMDAVTIKCKDLMYGDWCRDGHGFPMQITNVGDDYAYATFEGLEGDPWEFDDKDCQPCAIEITEGLLKANGWKRESYMMPPFDSFVRTYYFVKDEGNTHREFKCNTLTIWFDYKEDSDGVYSDILVPCKYVHQLQQVLRLAGMTDLANKFKV